MFYYKQDVTNDFMVLIEEPILEFVFWYNDIKLQWYKTGKEIYYTYPVIRAMTDITYILGDLVSKLLYAVYVRSTHLYVEPSGNWTSLIAIHNHVENFLPFYKFHFVEKYVYPTENEYITADKNMEVLFSHAKNTIEYDKNVYEILLTIKDSSDYFVRTCCSASAEYTPVVLPADKSEVELLCVEYRHPEMPRPIAINIPSSYFIVGNELLSMAFVRRMLEYKSVFTTFVFDERYTVNIIDQTINQYQLTSRNYIVLEKESIRVMEISADTFMAKEDENDDDDGTEDEDDGTEEDDENEEDDSETSDSENDTDEDMPDLIEIDHEETPEQEETKESTPVDDPTIRQSDNSDKDNDWEMSTVISESEE
jgi:hypothetical protein